MADITLEDLPAETTPTSDDIVHTQDTGTGADKKVTIANLTTAQFLLKDSDDLSEGTTNLYNQVPAGGTAGQVLSKIDATDYNSQWIAAGTGDVVGPGSAVDDNLATFDGTSGKLIQDGGQTVAGVLSRANHTGTQTASTISDFVTEVQSNSINNVVEDTTPQLGGNLDAQSNDITSVDRFDYNYAEGTVSALGNLGATEAIDWSTASYFTGTLDSNVTITHTNEVSGQKITLALAYDGSAQRTITWSDVDSWAGGTAPSAPSASGEVLIVTLLFLGTTCYASAEVFS